MFNDVMGEALTEGAMPEERPPGYFDDIMGEALTEDVGDDAVALPSTYDPATL